MTWLKPGIPGKNVKKRGNNLVKLSTSRPSALHKLCTGTHGDIVARLQHHSYTLGFNGSTSDRKYFLSPKMNQGFFHMGIQCGFLKQNSYMFWICGVTYISKPVTQDFLSHNTIGVERPSYSLSPCKSCS